MLFLLLLMMTAVSSSFVSIVALYGNQTFNDINLDTLLDSMDPPYDTYIVGTGEQVLLFWQPFSETGRGGEHGVVLLRGLVNFVNQTRDPENHDTLTIIMKNVGWGRIVQTPICVENQECPDLLLIGTTQVASRVAEGIIKPLTDYLGDYTFKHGQRLNDDFITSTFYDYYFNNNWYGVPFVSDCRILLFNTTTFDHLGLEYPPPHNDSWGDPYSFSWTWTKFVEYSRIIAKSYGKGTGFQWKSGWDEELKVIMMMAQNSGVTLVDSKLKCNLKNPRFKKIVEDVIVPLWVTDQSANLDFFLLGTEFEEWMKNPELGNPLDRPTFCCEGYFFDNLTGMSISTTVMHDEGTTKVGFVPGANSFLGGSGFAVVDGQNADLAWDIVLFFIDKNNPYLDNIAEVQASPPPYLSLLSMPLWSTNEWAIPSQQIRHSLPSQYPLSTFSQFGELEERKPFRLMLAEIIFKNVSVDEAIDRACMVIDFIFLPICTRENMEITVESCTRNTVKSISFEWTQNQTSICRVTTDLPAPMVVSCSFLPVESIPSLILVVVTSFLAFVNLVISFLFFIKRKIDIIKRAAFIFCEIIFLGCLLCYASVFLELGIPSTLTCVVRVWFLSFGFTLCYGGFCTKIYRIYKIFQIREKEKFMKYAKKLKVKDSYYLNILGILVLVEISLLLLWTLVPPKPGPTISVLNVREISTIINEPVCSDSQSITLTLLMTYKGLFLIFSIWVTINTWKVPSDYKERTFILGAICAIFFTLLIIVPTVLLVGDETTKIIYRCVGILFATTTSLWCFSIPKLLGAFYAVDSLVALSRERSSSVRRGSSAVSPDSIPKPFTS